MPTPSASQRLQHIREAEGYLELGSMFDDRWSLDLSLKTVMADSALFSLNKIVEPRSHRSVVAFLKGQACRLAERYAFAIKHYEESLQQEPENLHTLLAIAWCYKRLDQLPAAIDAMQSAIAYDPTSAIVNYNLACYLALDQQVSACIDRLAEALRLDSDFRDLIIHEADFDGIREEPGFQSLTIAIV